MFPISEPLPRDTASFHAALAGGLSPLGLSAEAVKLEGEFPSFEAARVDLTGARFHRRLEFSKPGETREPLCFARGVEISGEPVFVETVPVSLRVAASDVTLVTAATAGTAGAESTVAGAAGSGRVLMLGRADRGKLELSVSRAELEKALLAAGQAAAKAKGAEVQSVELRLESTSARSLAVEAIVTAKAMFFTTTVTIAGQVEVDDQLNARLRDLRCEGDGMIGKMAAGVLRPQFEQVQQRVFPLGRAVAGLVLEDVTVSGGEELRIQASFRSAA